MRKYLSWLCVLWLLNVPQVHAQEPTASFSTPNQSPLVGEPIQINLFVMLPTAAQVVSWPDFPEQWGDDFEVQTISEREDSQINGQVSYRQTLTVVLWKPGEYRTPAISIGYQLTDETTEAEIAVEPLTFTVPSVLTANETELRPFKPQIIMPFISPQFMIIGLCILTSIMWWAYRRWLAHRQRQLVLIPSQIRIADEALLAALQRLDQQGLEPAVIYALAANLLRDYVRSQFHVDAHELTTRELLRSLHNQLSVPMHQRLQQLLGQADLVKFARQEPDQRAARQYLEATARWIQNCARDLAHRREAA